MKQSIYLIKTLLLTLLLCVGSSTWGQVTNVSSGVIDADHVSDYYTIVNSYTSPISLNDVTSWEGDMPTNQGEHWNGSNDSYADRWSEGLLNQNDHYRRAYMSLSEGSYAIMTAGRGSAGVTLSMKVDNNEVTMDGRGNQGLGITTDGVASFSTSDTYANNPNGRGWQYFYIKFDVGSSGANVEIKLSGSSTEGSKWMSFTTPMLLKAVVVNDATTIRTSNSGSIPMSATFPNETTTNGTYVIRGSDFPDKANCRFIRFYLVDAVTNNPVAIPNLTSSQGTAFHNYGTLGMATSSNTAFLDGNDFTLTLPNVRGQYKLFCYLSTSQGTQEVVENVTRDVEPTITSAYEMDIAYPYPGSLRSGSIQTIEIPVNTGEKTHNVTELNSDYNVISTGLSSQGRALNEIQMHTWSDGSATATITGDYNDGSYTQYVPTQQVYGDGGVSWQRYVDLSEYSKLVVTVTSGTPRFLFNRTVNEGQYSETEEESQLLEYPKNGWSDRYFTREGNVYTVNLQRMVADKGFAHLHAIKGANWQDVTVESMLLYGTPLTDGMMHSWNGYGAGSYQTGAGSYSYVLGSSTTQPFGDANVIDYADLSEYDKLVVTMTSGTPRFLFNRTEDNGQCNQDESQSKLIEYPNYDWCNRYFTKDGNTYIVDLEKMRNEKGFVHLHAIKGANWQSVNIDRMELYKNSYTTGNVYARLFVADKNSGEQMADQNALTITPSTGWTKRANAPQNWVYYGSASGLKDALNNINVSSSNPLYQGNATVSLVISSNLTRLAPASPSTVNDIITEPNWEKQYLLDFYKTDNYIGSLQTGGTEVRSAISLEDAEVTSRLITEFPQFNISSDKVYARLFVADDAGETVDDQTLLSFGDLSSKGWTWREHYGWVYYGDGFSESQLQNITVSASTALAATGAMIGLVITTSDMSRIEPSGVSSAANITKEPNWEYLYLYHFTYPFAGTIKSNYFRHSKEVLLTSAEVSAGVTQIPLNEALSKIKSEYVKTNETLAQNLHIRWFVTYKGEMIANSEDYLAPVTSGTEHKTKDGYGIYWNSATCPTYPLSAGSESSSSQTINWLNMNFTKPDYGHWSDYKVVVWLSDDTSSANGQTTDGTVLTHEPDINMVYYYSFFVEEDFRFVHSKGAAVEAYPELPYLIKSSSVQQYDWDNTTSTQLPASGDIRQDVHTVIYDVYLRPNSGTYKLELPFQNYFGEGDVLEPAAYIRWYDWETDLGSNKLAIANPGQSWLESFTDFDTGNNRGFFSINRDLTAQSPTHDKVGVTYNTDGLSSTHVIACDVSKYFDGVYRGSNADTRPGFSGLKHPYMLHEPTLSLRYLLRIHPASEIVNQINTAKSSFDTYMAQNGANYNNLTSAQKKAMFALLEDNGRVAVSIKDASSKFALRANLSSLGEYYVGDANWPTQCADIWWTAYHEGADGKLYEKNLVTNSNRIHVFTFADLGGSYSLVGGGSSENVTAKAGEKFHVVGRIGTSTSDFQPVVHYELEFIDAPAVLVDDMDALGSEVLHRRKAYLDSHYIFGGRVYFDDYFPTTTLTNQNENHTEKPLKWADAQYGFCYPQIDQYRLSTGGNSALTPIHGDYILLKSIEGLYSQSMDSNQPYKYYFWRPEAQGINSEHLYDFTRDYGDGKYGSFLYVDASDEARTIASLEFDAKLCSGSQIFYTAAIADVTNGDANGGQTPPQLMIRVYEMNGGVKADKPIVSFLTGSLRSEAYARPGAPAYEYMKWYQTYGYTTIPSTAGISGEMKRYRVDIDNYCENTAGADYCVDEIRFYTSTGKVTVNMSGGTCADESMTFSANMDVEHLEAKMILTGTSSNPQHIYYRIYEKTGENAGNIQYQPYSDNSIYNNSGKSYGDVTICKYVLNTDGTLATGNPNNNGYEQVDGVLYFNLLKNVQMNLEQGKEYFIALTADLNAPEPNNETVGWANPNNACDVYSNFFVPRKTFISFLDDQNVVSSQTIQGDCGNIAAANVSFTVQVSVPDDQEATGFKVIPNGTTGSLSSTGPLFDFFKGTIAELNEQHSTHGNKTLLEALRAYRNFERNPPSEIQVTAYSTDEPAEGYRYQGEDANNYYQILKEAYDAGKLFMCASSTFDNTITETTSFLAIPVQDNSYEYSVDDKTYYLCDYLPFTFTVNGSFYAPTLVLGFEDVTYPEGIRVIRVGKEQLLNMQKSDGFLLHIPVNTFKVNDAATAKTGDLNIVGDMDLLKYATSDAYQTTDSKINADVSKVATFEATTINSSNMYVSVNFHGAGVTQPTFYEGYAYRMFFQVKDAADPTACEGNVEFLLKVVPEFVTWNGTSAEWNNDANWGRSTRTELYKSADATQNTATAAQGGIYQENSELRGDATIPNTYAPMKFTYVTIPSGLRAPNLINLSYNSEKIYENLGAGATANIQYDLMVRYTEQTCQDHSISGDVYDCEKFYGNWAKELYLKPAAELVNQQYLTYEKVWVEKELLSNTWTLMSTPLQNTYAGDMYVPYSNGRQETEAFQAISFNTTSYSRTKYPIYQKGWTQEGVLVYTKTNDIRANSYSANLKYNTVTTNLLEWSHVYNDVTVPYSTWTAFAIRPHKKTQTANTLIRLPKADASFDYYQWDNTSPAEGRLTQNVSKSTTGKLLTDGTANISGVTYGTVYGTINRTAGNGNFNAVIADIQSSLANYQLVGNPYLCSINMAEFIAGNEANLEVPGYWTYDNNNTGSPVTSGIIGPMQSFFVKAKDGATQIVFTPAMMTDGNTTAPSPAPMLGITLTAQNEHGQSAASVIVGEEQGSVEALFDSNLADVPMVYTVAGNQAVSINQLPTLDVVPFGVTCSSDEPVNVTMTGTDAVGGEFYVFDALDGSSTPVMEGETISVQPNDYGRYFLTRSSSLGTIGDDVTDGIIISVRGDVVTVTSASGLSHVRALTTAGVTIYQADNCGTKAQFQLQQGVYIIEADGMSGHRSVKVMVK